MKPLPVDDFYTYVNYDWLNQVQIPKDESSINNFVILREEMLEVLTGVIKKSKALSTMYQSGKNNRNDIQKLKELFNLISTITDFNQFFNILGLLNLLHISSPLTVGVTTDLKSSTTYRVSISQGHLGLPKEYYKDKKVSQKYQLLIGKVFSYFTNKDSTKYAKLVFQVEKSLAEFSLTPEEEMDIDKTYNLLCKHSLLDYCDMNLEALFTTMKITVRDEIIVQSLDYLKKLNAMLKTTPISQWRIYLLWCVISSLKNVITFELENIFFEFYGKELFGTDSLKPLNIRITEIIKNLLPDLVCREFKALQVTSDKDIRYIEEMIIKIKSQYKKKLINNKWMKQDTINKAIKKLDLLRFKVGYPKKYTKKYDDLYLTENFLTNCLKIAHYESEKLIEKYNTGTCVDKEEWVMKSFEVNACFIPTSNEIIIPSGILKAPFYSNEQSDAQNYGGIGSIIAHEIMHSFDVHGSRFDELGNLFDWWDKEDFVRYKKESEKLVKQFNAYGVNGRLTLGETFADLVGFEVAYETFKNENKSIKDKVEFMVHHAVCFREKMTEQKQKYQIATDPHAPEIYRINGVMSNIEDFYEIFNVKKSDKMYIPREERFTF